MAGCKREVMEPSGREKVAAAAALVAGLVGMWFMLAYSYVYINWRRVPGGGRAHRVRLRRGGEDGGGTEGVLPQGRNAPRVSRREGVGIRRIAAPAGKNK